ncbi:hypothetical protein [Mesorhizobium humile]|uniref:Uncharacterized protein n=1 Tax=Mesorhizobium humile TaxID=3072313 RepID=A0ABU4YQF7_9HYPH|nr:MULTISPECIES: hypothetical protein [unclassified Mesorhizobium]MDX8463022.1 hypothetical protein [Mesorhizobium sp. VK2D]MDX8489225.1 hypothetical protein [Mesorhizobium sp. VK2B]
MKTLPLLAATAVGLLGILATQPSHAGSDNGGGLTAASTADGDDDQVNTSSVGDDHEAAENDQAGDKGDGATSGSHEGDQDGDHQDDDHEGGDGGGHDSGGHDGGGDSGGHDGGGDSGGHDGGGD